MKHLLLLLAAMTAWAAGAADIAHSPQAAVTEFISDYAQWNAHASARTRNGHSQAAVQASERDYDALIVKFCRPGFKHQPISYGDESFHEPGLEVIVSSEINGRTAIVRSRHTTKLQQGEFASDFEYYLSSDGTRWFLESVLYVNGQEKYESL